MNALGAAFTLVTSLLLLSVPRRWAAMPLMLAASFMTRGQVLELGSAHLTVVRILVLIGLVRLVTRGESLAGGTNNVDRLLIAWALVLLGTSVFHDDAWVYRAGVVTDLGCYFLFRIFLNGHDDVIRIFKATCVLLVPLAALMLLEKVTGQNAFGLLGGVNEISLVREGHIRASGPFAHPILAGTAGATCFGMAACLWREHRGAALAGLLAAAGIVVASTSSGPILMVAFILLGLCMWPLRRQMPLVRWATLTAIIVLAAVMNDPVYFLVARIDISGGSQGYFRAQLIRSAIEHLDEWWLGGTDYTRHWMSSGTYANERHTDITNELLAMGVMGGLLLMLVFAMVIVVAFRAVGRTLQERNDASADHRFVVWALGCILFGHFMNFMSISLFDQSVLFFYVVLAAIGAVGTGQFTPAWVGSPNIRKPPAPSLGVGAFAIRASAPAHDMLGPHRSPLER